MTTNITPKTFEESLIRLEEIVRQLDDSQTDLETALLRYEEGVRLLKHCHNTLESAQRKIEILRNGNNDNTLNIETVDEKEFKTNPNTKLKE
ncbi:MAG: exodeoxyribonuclease VII small subunit [Planctomycetaceae bacterium]|jgi:exodeoxyribonuclease VII small subunit|nr:exodeoxyribonuclease VII small subunit [Planctomycetaceae bacterium]